MSKTPLTSTGGPSETPVRASTVSDLMSREVVSISPEASIRDLVRLLRRHGISGVPVVEERAVVGTVSVSDLVWLSDQFGEKSWDVRGRERELRGGRVGDVMTPDVFAIAPTAGLAELARFFARTGLRRAVVLDGDRLVGIVSVTDLLALIVDDLDSADDVE